MPAPALAPDAWLASFPAVRRNLPLFLTLLAWLLATGSQWDLVQVFAWGRMLSRNLEAMPWRSAVARTFSPEGRCKLCNAVSSAKQQADNAAAPNGRVNSKVQLAFEPAPTPVVAVPDLARWLLSRPSTVSLARSAPPVPPPRA